MSPKTLVVRKKKLYEIQLVFYFIAGLNHKQQEAIMKSFREGNHKIIICTPDSAGEGIDVSGCNFVINYDYLKTEVHMVQIKGKHVIATIVLYTVLIALCCILLSVQIYYYYYVVYY